MPEEDAEHKRKHAAEELQTKQDDEAQAQAQEEAAPAAAEAAEKEAAAKNTAEEDANEEAKRKAAEEVEQRLRNNVEGGSDPKRPKTAGGCQGYAQHSAPGYCRHLVAEGIRGCRANTIALEHARDEP